MGIMEMNMHVPQTLESVVELKLLTSVPTQIISPRTSGPVAGLVQDSLLGSYLLSKQVGLNVREMMHMMCGAGVFNQQLPLPANANGFDSTWTGQQFISTFLPKINYSGGGTKIVNGQLISGMLEDKTLGKNNNSLFHITWSDHGPHATRDLFNSFSIASNMMLQNKGFTCSISDCFIDDESIKQIHDIILKHKTLAATTIASAKLGAVPKDVPDGITYCTEFPHKMLLAMNTCRGEVEAIASNAAKLSGLNNIDTMVTCKSKGSANNIGQITAMLGQQQIDGNWIENQFYRRTLPHYYKDDIRPEAHGFVENSFTSGLNPAEYWFHTQEGRVGLIAKAIKTAETGYIQRKLIKIMEDSRICYDGTVRNANGMIIQMVYGNDGFDPCYVEQQEMFFYNYNHDRLNEVFNIDMRTLQAHLTPNAWADFLKSDEQTRAALLKDSFGKIVDLHKYIKTEVPLSLVYPKVKAPVNFKRIILNAIQNFNLQNALVTDIEPIYIIHQLNELDRKLIVNEYDDEINRVSTILFKCLMYTYLAPKKVIYEYKLSRMAFDHIVEIVNITFMKSLINPGDNVGVLGAQSIGEPSTQMALNTFHYTGQGTKSSAARGMGRFKEVLGLTKNPKTPTMTIYVEENYMSQKPTNESKDYNMKLINKLMAEAEYTTVRMVVNRCDIYYDLDDRTTCVPDDQEFIDSYYDTIPKEQEALHGKTNYPWLLRIEYDREKILQKHMSMSYVASKLAMFLKTQKIESSVIANDDNASRLITRIKISAESLSDYSGDPIHYLRDVSNTMLDIQLKGIENIEKCATTTVKKDIVLPNGDIVSLTTSSPAEYEAATKLYNNVTYTIETDGSNLIEVMKLPHIDTYRTVTSDVWEVYHLYGIEAARKCIIAEILFLLECNGTYIQDRHIQLLVDSMTNQGSLVSVDRHGMSKSDSGPLHRASFEETTAQLTSASIFSEVDYMTGVSGNIMWGQFIPTGTNAFRISMDLEKMKTQQPVSTGVVSRTVGGKLVVSEATESDQCNEENFEFMFKLGKRQEV